MTASGALDGHRLRESDDGSPLIIMTTHDGAEPARAALQRSFRGAHGFGAWLAALDTHPKSLNVGSYLGATTVRAYAMGQSPGPARGAALDTMRAVVRHAMRDGAFGISSALIYPPGSYASTAELVEMAKAMASGRTRGTPAAIASFRAPPIAKISRPQRV